MPGFANPVVSSILKSTLIKQTVLPLPLKMYSFSCKIKWKKKPNQKTSQAKKQNKTKLNQKNTSKKSTMKKTKNPIHSYGKQALSTAAVSG